MHSIHGTDNPDISRICLMLCRRPYPPMGGVCTIHCPHVLASPSSREVTVTLWRLQNLPKLYVMDISPATRKAAAHARYRAILDAHHSAVCRQTRRTGWPLMCCCQSRSAHVARLSLVPTPVPEKTATPQSHQITHDRACICREHDRRIV